jgi:membrane fusion protein (multidrug efflux system)
MYATAKSPSSQANARQVSISGNPSLSRRTHTRNNRKNRPNNALNEEFSMTQSIPVLPAFARSGPVQTIATASLFLFTALLIGACDRAPPGMGGMPPAAVTYLVAAPQEIAVEQEFVAQANGSREVEIRARVNGIIEKRLYSEGSTVKAGTPLFRLDAAPYAAAVAQAEAALATADANLKQAEREYNRLKPLLDAKAISQKEWDSAASAFDVARAQQKQAQAQLTSARVDLGYTNIVAPISGAIGRALKVEGALANAASDSLLTTMAQIDPIHVNFAITENERNSAQSEIAAGTLKLPAGGYVVKLKTAEGQSLKPVGRLNFTDYKADANTGTYAARAEFPNADGALAPGQFVRVVLTGAKRPAAIVVPQRAVLDGPMGKYVYLVGKGKDGKPAAEQRPVVPGEWVALEGKEHNGWVIREGIKAGDQVIIDGTARIFFPGQAIMPMTPAEAEAAAKAAPAGPGGPPPADKK